MLSNRARCCFADFSWWITKSCSKTNSGKSIRESHLMVLTFLKRTSSCKFVKWLTVATNYQTNFAHILISFLEPTVLDAVHNPCKKYVLYKTEILNWCQRFFSWLILLVSQWSMDSGLVFGLWMWFMWWRFCEGYFEIWFLLVKMCNCCCASVRPVTIPINLKNQSDTYNWKVSSLHNFEQLLNVKRMKKR